MYDSAVVYHRTSGFEIRHRYHTYCQFTRSQSWAVYLADFAIPNAIFAGRFFYVTSAFLISFKICENVQSTFAALSFARSGHQLAPNTQLGGLPARGTTAMRFWFSALFCGHGDDESRCCANVCLIRPSKYSSHKLPWRKEAGAAPNVGVYFISRDLGTAHDKNNGFPKGAKTRCAEL